MSGLLFDLRQKFLEKAINFYGEAQGYVERLSLRQSNHAPHLLQQKLYGYSVRRITLFHGGSVVHADAHKESR